MFLFHLNLISIVRPPLVSVNELMSHDTLFHDRAIVGSAKPNTHRRRRRDETVLSRRVGDGGVYWA